jgi:hypothetical protein
MLVLNETKFITWGFNDDASQLWHVLRKNNNIGGINFIPSLLSVLLLVLLLTLGDVDTKLLE